jgi:Na+-transporting NADH:ubiquinone oxidoreductase subunit C
MSKDSIGKVFVVATLLCVVCSVLVSTAALGLRPLQEENAVKEVKRNILAAAGMLPAEGKYDLEALFGQMETVVVDLSSGRPAEGVDPKSFDSTGMERDPKTSAAIPEEWVPRVGLRARAKMEKVYLKRGANGAVETVVLPIHGKGLWSTMYAFLALEADLKTVKGLVFYKHGETPGLGGEVDNPIWKGQWPGKQLYDAEGKYAFKVLKGRVTPGSPQAPYQADGLSGATITTNGIDGTLAYWLGPAGYGPFLEQLRTQEARRG